MHQKQRCTVSSKEGGGGILSKVSEQFEHVLVWQLAAVLSVKSWEASAFVQSPWCIFEHRSAETTEQIIEFTGERAYFSSTPVHQRFVPPNKLPSYDSSHSFYINLKLVAKANGKPCSPGEWHPVLSQSAAGCLSILQHLLCHLDNKTEDCSFF